MAGFSSLLGRVVPTGQLRLAVPMRLADLHGAAAAEPAFPLGLAETHRMTCFNGSAALAQMALQAELGPDDLVLMPAYVCGSELEALAPCGCRFGSYRVAADLQVDLQDLREQLEAGAVKAVLITHYFGFAQRQVEQIAELCSRHGALLIEDCAHALFAELGEQALGRFGDYAVYSPRKSLPLTEGGLLIANHRALSVQPERKRAPIIPVADRLINALISARKVQVVSGRNRGLNALTQLALLPVSLAVKSLRMVGARLLPDWLSPEIDGEAAQALHRVKMSGLSAGILRRSEALMFRQARQDNYRRWLAGVEGMSECEALLPRLEPGCCPLYFPVVTADPQGLVEALGQQGVEAYHWWSNLHPAIDLSAYPQLQNLKQQVLALPVHQRLNSADIDTMVAALTGCLAAREIAR